MAYAGRVEACGAVARAGDSEDVRAHVARVSNELVGSKFVIIRQPVMI